MHGMLVIVLAHFIFKEDDWCISGLYKNFDIWGYLSEVF